MKRLLCIFLSLLMLLSAGAAWADGTAEAKVITDQLSPVIVSATLDKDVYVPGDTIVLTVNATDKSGFNNREWSFVGFRYSYTDKDGTSCTGYQSLDEPSTVFDGKNASYVFSAHVGEKAIPGLYTLYSLEIPDKYGNRTSTAFPFSLKFTVENQKVDPLAKVISLKLNKTSAAKGGTIKLTAKVSNAVDNEWENSAYFYNDETGDCIIFNFRQVSGTTYEAIAEIPDGIAPGTYRLSSCRFSNGEVTSNYNKELSFKVKGSSSDTDGWPRVLSVKTEKSKYKDNETVRVTITTDKPVEAPEKCTVYFSAGTEYIGFYGMNKIGDNKYVTEYTVQSTDVAGTYSLSNIWFPNANSVPAYDGQELGKFMLYDKKFVKLTSFTLNKSKVTVYLHPDSNRDKLELKMKSYKPSNASILTLKYEIDDGSIGWIDPDGCFYANNPGTAIITARAQDGSGKTATCKVTVKKILIDKITLNKTRMTVKKGKIATLKATLSPSKNVYDENLRWYSSDTSVAKVDSAGNVTGVGKGKCTIYACAQDGGEAAAKCKVTVK